MSRSAELLRGQAEVMKLARLLGREPDELAYLERLAPADLRALRDSVTETLYDAHGSSLARLAAASRLLPAGITATIGQRAFGALLSARLAGLLETDKAVEVATKLPPPFLADVAVELDPRRASDLIGAIAPALIGQVTAELVARREYVTMGRFVGHLSDEAIAAAVAAMDDEALLQVAFVLEDPSQLSRLFAKLPGAARRESSSPRPTRACGWRRWTSSTTSTSASARKWCSPPSPWTRRRRRRSSTRSSRTTSPTRSGSLPSTTTRSRSASRSASA